MHHNGTLQYLLRRPLYDHERHRSCRDELGGLEAEPGRKLVRPRARTVAVPILFSERSTERRIHVILDFQTNQLTTVEELSRGLWRVIARTDEDLFSAALTLDIRTPALDIQAVRFDVSRDELAILPDLSSAMEKLVGVRVGPGMTKIVRAVVRDEGGSERVAEMVLDAMEMLINALTVPQLRKATGVAGQPVMLDGDGPKVRLNNVLLGDEQIKLMAENPRLKNSCVAFRDL